MWVERAIDTFGPEDIVLGPEKAIDGAHENSTLPGEIRVNLLLKCGLIQIPTSHTNTQRIGSLFGFPREILVEKD